MVKAIVEINEKANRVINIVKAKENLKDKSDAINLIIEIYGGEMLEPELMPKFISELKEAKKEKGIKFGSIKDLKAHIEKNA